MARVFRRTWTDPKTGESRTSPWYSMEWTSPDGRAHRRLIKPLTAQRRLAEEALYRELARGETTSQMRGRGLTVRQVLEEYLGHLRANAPASVRSKASWVEWWISTVGDRAAADLHLRDVDQAVTYLAEHGRKPGTIHGYLTILRAAFNRAIRAGLLEGHPIASLEIRHRSPKRQATFTAEELARLRAELQPRASVSRTGWGVELLDVLLETGIRIGDALALRWEAVLPTPWPGPLPPPLPEALRFVQGKTGTETAVPLSPAAGAVLGRLRAAAGVTATGLVWPNRDGGPRTYSLVLRYFTAALRRARIEGRTIHDLRRTFSQRLRERGVDDAVISALLGHRSAAAVQHYRWITGAMMAAALGRKIALPPDGHEPEATRNHTS